MGHGVQHHDVLVAEQEYTLLQDIIRPDGQGWKIFEEQWSLPRTPVTPNLYARMRASIPWDASPPPPPTTGQWLAPKEGDGSIKRVFHITRTDPLQATLYHKAPSEQLHDIEQLHHLPEETLQEVRVLQCGGPRRVIFDINPKETPDPDQTLWLWGKE